MYTVLLCTDNAVCISCVWRLHMFAACSLELHFVGGSSKRIRYFDWSRWLSALELELRQPGISVGAMQVGPQNRVFCQSFGNRVFETLGSGTDACGYPILFKKVEPQYRFSIWNRVEPENRRNCPSPHVWYIHVHNGGLFMFVIDAIQLFNILDFVRVWTRNRGCDWSIHKWGRA